MYQNQVGTTNLWGTTNYGNKVIIFSGHAYYDLTQTQTDVWKHAGVTTGWINRSSLWDATYTINGVTYSDSDSSRIKLTDSSHSYLANNFVYKSSTQQGYSLIFQMGSGYYWPGSTLCVVGWGGVLHDPEQRALRCGTVQAINVAPVGQTRSDGTTIVLNKQVLVDFDTARPGNGLYEGDSGALVFGIGSDGVGWAGVAATILGHFSKSGNVQDDLLLTACYTSNCQ